MSGDHNMYASGSGDGQRSGWRKRTIMEMALDTGFDTDDETTLESLERFGLTDEEVMEIAFNFDVPSLVVRTAEARLKDKNT